MKRMICLLVLTIMVVVIPASQVFSLADPYGHKEVDRDNGEDHPWGGEDHYNDNGSAVQGQIDFGGGISGYLAVDIVNYFFGYFVDRFATSNTNQTNSFMIIAGPTQTQTEEPVKTMSRTGN